MSCGAITKNLEHCKNNSLEHSFFCGLHKKNLYNVSEFHLLHSGNIDEILKDNTIKTSEETKKGTIAYTFDKRGKLYKRKGKLRVIYFSQTFFELVFPKVYTIDKYEPYNRRTENSKFLELNPNILKYLSKIENFEAHFVSSGYAFGNCRPEYCATYDKTKSVKENLNMMYYFYISKRIEKVVENGIKDIKNLRKEVFTNYDFLFNEFVINMSVPLEIDGKNYIKKIF